MATGATSKAARAATTWVTGSRWLLLGVSLLLLSGCRTLLFHPQQAWVRTPADVGLSYREQTLTAADGTRLSAWWLPAEGEERGAILFLHGNAENISTHLASVYWLPAAGYSVLLLDYRGFGASEGETSVPGALEDVTAGLTWLVAYGQQHQRRLFVLGQSIGASLAVPVLRDQPALTHQLNGVVLDAALARYSQAAQEVARRSWLTWPLQYPVGAVMPDGIDPIDGIAAISPVPLLIIHGEQDGVIDIEHGRQLFAQAGEPKYLLTYPGGHISTFNAEGNRRYLLDFLDDGVIERPAVPTVPGAGAGSVGQASQAQ